MSDLISAGVGPFGNAQDPEIVPCAVCGDPVQHVDKFMVEKEIIHKTCFICAYCDAKLQVGYCAQELSLYNRYGPCWYCTLICAHRPLGDKEEKLKANGVEVRNPSTRRPKAKSGQTSGINVLPAGAGLPSAAAAAAQPAGEVAPPPPAAVASEESQPPTAPAEGVGEVAATAVAQENGVAIEAGEDGPEMEAEEVPKAEAVEAVEEGKKDEEETSPPEVPAETAPAVGGGGGDEEDGPEMEAEEVVRPSAPAPADPSTEAVEHPSPPPASDEGVPSAQSEDPAAQQQAVGDEVPSPPSPLASPNAPKEAKPVAMDAYENKYRMQMKKKK